MREPTPKTICKSCGSEFYVDEDCEYCTSSASQASYISVDIDLPRTGQKVLARYEGVYTNRIVIFWMDYELTPHFGRIDEPDGKGSQPATHWKEIEPINKNCEACATVTMKVLVPARLSHTGKDRWAEKPIDKCLVPFVRALNDAGIYTANCCCGHGYRSGEIILHTGQTLIIKPEPE